MMSDLPENTDCPDCGVSVGYEHDTNCDVARCLHTGHQRLSCFHGHGFRRRRDTDTADRSGPPGWVWCDILDALTDEHPNVPPRAEIVTRVTVAAHTGAAETTEVSACGCNPDLLHDDCGDDVWTGEWPGEDEAAALGWYAYFGPEADPPEAGWIRCTADHPGARPDLNRLTIDGRWDREAHKWVAPVDA